ncbi:hypothetical protein ACNQKP_11885 [Bdellovibrio bacteriovorus]|uniref:baeRF3 domain-containing protein n=1 Tax=Bdellovibrio bacteriovorus TaxID=959 RepID=UPI003AA83E1E
MLEKLTHDDLLMLTSVNEGPCISIYIPGMPDKTLLLEYETLVRRAAHLLSLDAKNGEKKELLDSLYSFNPAEHLQRSDFGMAIFVNKHWKGFYMAAHTVPSKVVVAESFHLKPLLEDLQGESSYHILTLTPLEAVLLHCDGGSGTEIHNFLFHQGQHSNSIHWKHLDETETSQIPHLKSHMRGRGLDDNQCKKKSGVKLFLRWIEAKISREPGYKQVPLFVFAGENMFHTYKEVTSHPSAVFFKMDPSKSSPRMEALIHQAQIHVKKELAQQRNLSAYELEKMNHQKKVIDDLVKISRAAINGHVRTLFLQNNSEIWGELHRKSGQITFHEKQTNAKDDDILDDIACEVIRHGGEVVVLSKEDMPSQSPAAAILNS